MSELSDFQIGQTVELSDGRAATIQFVGSTHFAAGDWIGVKLEEATGKNDGEVQGQRYFECPAGHGMFVRPAAVTFVDHPTPKPATRMNGKLNGQAFRPRPSNMAVGGGKGQGMPDSTMGKRQSVNAASPTPASKVSRLGSPSKSPTKQFTSNVSSGTSSGTGTPTSTVRKSMLPPSKGNRISTGPPPPLSSSLRASRPSIAEKVNGSVKPTSQNSSLSRGPANQSSIRAGVRDKISSTSDGSRLSGGSGHRSPTSPDSGVLSPASGIQEEQRQALSLPYSQTSGGNLHASEKSLMFGGRSPSTAAPRAPATAASLREIEDLKTKLRLVEKKRIEDREKLKAMDKAQADRDRFENIIQKLQSKYQPQQQELTDLKRQLKVEHDKIRTLEAQQAETDSIQEMATLDREMAEETAESLRLELDALRLKYEEIELEVNVLREENDELGKEISPEDKTSQGWLQLERSNERLREALVRLRDVSQEQEASLKDQIKVLESDVWDMTKTKEQLVQTKEILDQSNSTNEDLRQQLDTALGAEDMIEELTEKNMALNEKMEEMKLTIEDLESLKELNDELEINHTETEKQLQEEIDYNESLLAEEARKAAVQDGTIQDLEYTVSRFRELVTNMQSDLEDMKASQQITETEANELTSRSRAMMDLNMRLQTSVTKSQVKAIDLELGKMQAQESLEHLSILQLFVPKAFIDEEDSVQAFLRFRRIGFKAHMMHSFVKERIAGPTTPGQEEDIFASSDVLDKLTWMFSTCDRFIYYIQTSDLEKFKRLGGASYELDPVERAFNVWIDSFKRDELKVGQCVKELQRSIALMSHLAEVHIHNDLEHYPDLVLTHASVMQSHLESATAILTHFRARLEHSARNSEVEGQVQESDYLETLGKLDILLSQTRSAKVVSSKTLRQLEDLKSRSLTLNPSTIKVVEQTERYTYDFISSVRSFGTSLLQHMNDEMQGAELPHQKVVDALSTASDSVPSLITKLHCTISQLQTFHNLASSLTQIVEFLAPPPPPWKVLAENLRAETADLAARESQLGRLKDELVEKNTAMAFKDKIVEELSVKVEVLEKRVGDSSGRREKVRELELAVETAKLKEKDLLSKLSRLRVELENLETERETWKQISKSQRPSAYEGQAPPTAEITTSAASLRQIDYLKTEISALQSSIRYFHSAQHKSLLSSYQSYLSTPLIPSAPQPSPLEPEARDVLKEMLHLVSLPTSQPVKLQLQSREDRLRWRPVKETSTWQIRQQREEWEEWREWRDDVAKRSLQARKDDQRKKSLRWRSKALLTPNQMRLPRKGDGGHVHFCEA